MLQFQLLIRSANELRFFGYVHVICRETKTKPIAKLNSLTLKVLNHLNVANAVHETGPVFGF